MNLYEAGPNNGVACAMWVACEDVISVVRYVIDGEFHLAHIAAAGGRRSYLDALQSLIEREIDQERQAVMAAAKEAEE